MTKYIAIAVACLLGAAAWAQTPPPLSFEVASVKPAAPCCAPGQWRESKVLDDRVDLRYVTLKYCLALAYRLKEFQVSGPAWLGELRFDIVAKGPEGTRRDQLPEMMQTLLNDRFKMEAHPEKKDFNVYALIRAQSPLKLKPAPEEPGDDTGAKFGISMAGAGVGRIEVRHSDMTALANTLFRFVGRPVVNLTELEGRYDFELEFSPEDANVMGLPGTPSAAAPAASETGVSIFASIQRIGLKLDPRKMPLDTVVVDRAEKTATEN